MRSNIIKSALCGSVCALCFNVAYAGGVQASGAASPPGAASTLEGQAASAALQPPPAQYAAPEPSARTAQAQKSALEPRSATLQEPLRYAPASDQTARDPAAVDVPRIKPYLATSSKPAPVQKLFEQENFHAPVGPYDAALACLSTQLIPSDKIKTWTVGDFPDGTGQVNSISDAGTGTFSTQAASRILKSSLVKAGVVVVESGPTFEHITDWYLQKAAQGLVGDGNKRLLHDPKTGVTVEVGNLRPWEGTLMPIHFMVQGAITSLDFVPGGGAGANLAGFQGTHIVNSIRVVMDAQAVQMAVGTQLGGQIVASAPLAREVYGEQNSVGVSRFFGSKFFSFTLGNGKREALQAVQRAMLDGEAARLVSGAYGIHACDPQIAYGDMLAFQAD